VSYFIDSAVPTFAALLNTEFMVLPIGAVPDRVSFTFAVPVSAVAMYACTFTVNSVSNPSVVGVRMLVTVGTEGETVAPRGVGTLTLNVVTLVSFSDGDVYVNATVAGLPPVYVGVVFAPPPVYSRLLGVDTFSEHVEPDAFGIEIVSGVEASASTRVGEIVAAPNAKIFSFGIITTLVYVKANFGKVAYLNVYVRLAIASAIPVAAAFGFTPRTVNFVELCLDPPVVVTRFTGEVTSIDVACDGGPEAAARSSKVAPVCDTSTVIPVSAFAIALSASQNVDNVRVSGTRLMVLPSRVSVVVLPAESSAFFHVIANVGLALSVVALATLTVISKPSPSESKFGGTDANVFTPSSFSTGLTSALWLIAMPYIHVVCVEPVSAAFHDVCVACPDTFRSIARAHDIAAPATFGHRNADIPWPFDVPLLPYNFE
jgi:hypothetical protein